VLPLAIGAVVEGVLNAFHTPLSGHFSPVLACVPIGAFDMINSSILLLIFFRKVMRWCECNIHLRRVHNVTLLSAARINILHHWPKRVILTPVSLTYPVGL
jgi:hypothetical protein